MDEEAHAEAWVHKPRRILQNQTLIQGCIVLTIVIPWPLACILFWTLFTLCPNIVIPSLVTLWAIAAAAYTILRIYYRNR